jgi:hypothetical protein
MGGRRRDWQRPHLRLSVAYLRGLATTLRHLFAVSFNAGEELVPEADRFLKTLRAERPLDATLAAAEMQRVSHPVVARGPTAVVDEQMVTGRGVRSPKGEKSSRHGIDSGGFSVSPETVSGAYPRPRCREP